MTMDDAKPEEEETLVNVTPESLPQEEEEEETWRDDWSLLSEVVPGTSTSSTSASRPTKQTQLELGKSEAFESGDEKPDTIGQRRDVEFGAEDNNELGDCCCFDGRSSPHNAG